MHKRPALQLTDPCSCEDYTSDMSNLTAHLTNQYVQKKHASYAAKKDDTVWSMEQFNDYVNAHVAPAKGLPKDWVNFEFKVICV